jgi:hypothetical protein
LFKKKPSLELISQNVEGLKLAEDCLLSGPDERQLTRKLTVRMEISEAIADPFEALNTIPLRIFFPDRMGSLGDILHS